MNFDLRAVVQRVTSAEVKVDGESTGKIDTGLLVFVGVAPDDGESDIRYIADKIINLRIFEDSAGKMNLSLSDVGGSVLAVSQFTLFGDCRKGRRPNFSSSCEPVKAEKIYNEFVDYLISQSIDTKCGIFGADMKVSLLNDGPVTILLDSTKIL